MGFFFGPREKLMFIVGTPISIIDCGFLGKSMGADSREKLGSGGDKKKAYGLRESGLFGPEEFCISGMTFGSTSMPFVDLLSYYCNIVEKYYSFE